MPAQSRPLLRGKAAAPPDPMTPEQPDMGPPEGVDMSGASKAGGPDPLTTEDDNFLMGPTDRPQEKFVQGAVPTKQPVPTDIHRWLPKLLDAAEDPNAPEELHVFLRLLRMHTGA